MVAKLSIISLLAITFLSSCQDKPLFSKLDANDTGIDFSNRIIENDTLNILDFEYVYNGGGVGIADMNGDSLPDVVFSGNQADSRLYLNKGKIQFENVSTKAGISNLGRWCSGVSLVDINADGIHPASGAILKVSTAIMNFMKSSSITKNWFLRN